MLKSFTQRTLFLLLLSLTSAAWAQQDPEARKVLDAMSNKYQGLTSFSADLVQVLSNDGSGLREEISGQIAVSGNRYWLDMGSQQMANDGEKVYVYLEEVNEITIDFFYPEEGSINPSEIYNIYKRGYKYTKLADQTINGKACHMIDLIPESANSTQFYRIRLAVDKATYQLQQYTMWDRGNTEYAFMLTNYKVNVSIPDSKFVFNTSSHPGADIVDLTN
ncbi:MAG: outer membrane lipoprotein carrier protein LolA [Bacteroidota bacterium]